MEDYLEAAIMLKEKGEKVTLTAQRVGWSKKPSIFWTLKKLGDSGLVIQEKYGGVELKPESARIAATLIFQIGRLFA